MPSITDDIASNDPAKIFLLGDNGTGKTGAKASLICEGYKLRMIDTDKGVKTLKSLLLDPRYPYNAVIKRRNIDLSEALNYIPIDVPMGLVQVKNSAGKLENILAPKDATAWQKVIDLLEHWKDGNRDYGHVKTWGPEVILDFDTFSTLAQMSYYFIQGLNGRLGAREEGYDFQRDVGSAQSQLRRLLEMLHSSAIKCNVIITTHIVRADTSRGTAESPEQRLRNNQPIDAKGFPEAIGRALSTKMGKYVCDVFITERIGSGQSTKYKISTVPVDNTAAKKSVYLEPQYDVSTGLAEIFAALRGQPAPKELIEALKPRTPVYTTMKAAQ